MPCSCSDPHRCTCTRPQFIHQWLPVDTAGSSTWLKEFTSQSSNPHGHPILGPSSIPFPQTGSTSYAHHEFYDPSIIQHGPHISQPYIPYNTNYSAYPAIQTRPLGDNQGNATNVAPQLNPPAAPNRRKRRNATSARGGAAKRTRIAAAMDTSPISTHCGVGPSDTTILRTDSASSPTVSPHLPAVPAPTSSALASTSSHPPSISTQLPTESYSSLSRNRKPRERSAAATDVYYFCRVAQSQERPTELPPPDQEPILKSKPASQWLSCTLCKYVSS